MSFVLLSNEVTHIISAFQIRKSKVEGSIYETQAPGLSISYLSANDEFNRNVKNLLLFLSIPM